MDASHARFAEPRATRDLPLGTCTCEGAPHVNGDSATVRTDVGWGELRSAFGAGQQFHEDGSGYYDEALGDATAIARFTLAWSLVDVGPKGRQEPRPITVTNVLRLDEETFKALKAHFDELVEAKGHLPNGSSAQSPDSSRKSASPTRTTPRRP